MEIYRNLYKLPLGTAPDGPVKVKKFEGNMDKLGALYFRGYKDGRAAAPKIREYLEN